MAATVLNTDTFLPLNVSMVKTGYTDKKIGLIYDSRRH